MTVSTGMGQGFGFGIGCIVVVLGFVLVSGLILLLIFSIGFGSADPTPAELRERCTAGDYVACDTLVLVSPFFSEDWVFGASCGGRVPPGLGGPCTQIFP